MNRMTGPDCAVMHHLINIHTHREAHWHEKVVEGHHALAIVPSPRPPSALAFRNTVQRTQRPGLDHHLREISRLVSMPRETSGSVPGLKGNGWGVGGMQSRVMCLVGGLVKKIIGLLREWGRFGGFPFCVCFCFLGGEGVGVSYEIIE